MDPTVYSAVISIGGLGLIFGLGLAYASKKFAVHVDPRVEAVLEILPGANCGGCGHPGCSGFAEAVVKGEAQVDGCPVGGTEVARRIGAVLGVEVGEIVPQVAVVQCRGDRQRAVERFVYEGIEDCHAAQLVSGGSKACPYGCLGLASCVKACPFGAIEMGPEGLPAVLEDRCTGCGICVKTCPRGILRLLPRNQKIYVGCVSKERGKAVKDVCAVGCTGCGLCSKPKITPSGAVTMVDNLPSFGPDWEDFDTAVEKCPGTCFVLRIVEET